MAAPTYRGTVADRSGTIILEDGSHLPPGTGVLVTPAVPVEPRRGSPLALVAAMRGGPRVTPEDVADLMRIIEEGHLPTDRDGPFATEDEPEEP